MTTQTWAVTDSARIAIDTLFASYTNSTPGAAMAIYREGEVIYANGYGMANLEHNIPITPASVFDIASISKQFTSMCVALLQQDGLLNVDDQVHTYIPELPEWDYPVTVRHLIHHVSGITDYLDILPMVGWRDEDQMTLADCLKYATLQKMLEFEPNTKYAYSNSGYVLLAILVERVSGVPMSRFAQERIFGPLGMRNSHFNDDHATIIPHRAQAFRVHDDGSYRLDTMPLDDLVGDGGLFTSVNDFGKWVENFSTGTVGGSDLLEMTQTPGTFRNGTPMDYAWGLEVDQFHGFHRVGHSGSWAGYRSDYFWLPELGFGVAVFANIPEVDPGLLTDKIAEIVVADMIAGRHDKPKSGTATNQKPAIDTSNAILIEPQLLAGKYVQDNTGSHLHIQADEDKLYIDLHGDLVLEQQEDGRFTQKWGHFVIIPTSQDANGVTSLNVVMTYDGETQTFGRVHPAPNTQPTDYAGRYFSEELDTYWDIDADDRATLFVRMPRVAPLRFEQLDDDRFGTGSLRAAQQLRFDRDGDRNITGFRYHRSGKRDITFTRAHQSS